MSLWLNMEVRWLILLFGRSQVGSSAGKMLSRLAHLMILLGRYHHMIGQLIPWGRVHMKGRVAGSSRYFPRFFFFCNLTVYYLVNNSQPLVPVLNQMNPVHIPTPCFNFSHIYLQISKWPLPFRFPAETSNEFLIIVDLVTSSNHIILFHFSKSWVSTGK